MKKLIIWSCVFMAVLPIFCEEIAIYSWNINGNNSRKMINTLTEFVKREHTVDILALQQVKLNLTPKDKNNLVYYKRQSPDFLDNLRTALQKATGDNWEFISTADYAIRKPVDQYTACLIGEDNAVFYRRTKLRARDLSQTLGLNNFTQSLHKLDKNNAQIIEFTTVNDAKLYFINLALTDDTSARYTQNLTAALNLFEGRLSHSKHKVVVGSFHSSPKNLTKHLQSAGFGHYKMGIKAENQKTFISKKYTSSNSNFCYDHFLYTDTIAECLIGSPQCAGSLILNAKNIKKKGSIPEKIVNYILSRFGFEEKNTRVTLGTTTKTLEFKPKYFRKKISPYLPIKMRFSVLSDVELEYQKQLNRS